MQHLEYFSETEILMIVIVYVIKVCFVILYWHFLWVSDIDFIVVTGNILRSVKDILSLNRENRYTEDRYTGVLPHTVYYNLCWQTNVDRYTGNIVIPKIVKPEFHRSRYQVTVVFALLMENKLTENVWLKS